MKNGIIFKRYSIALTVAISGLFLLSACDKDDDDIATDEVYTISGVASGGQEVPAVTTSATGTLSGSYNKSNNTLIYSIDWSGLSGDASMAHFHGPAAAGVNADVLLPLNILTNGINGSARDTLVVEDAVETALLAGTIYYNLHTIANPGGEIRGQVSTVKN